MICPACAAGIASWMLAGSLGTGGAAAAAIHWRRKKAGSIKQEDNKIPGPVSRSGN